MQSRPSPMSPRSATFVARAVLFGALALVGFVKIGADVRSHECTRLDDAIQAWVLAHQDPVARRAFQWVTILGGITGMRMLALGGAAVLWSRGRRGAPMVVLVAPVVAATLFNLVKRVYARPRPLTGGFGGRVDSDFSFPSGHGTTSAAVCCTLAYVLWREGLISRSAAITLAVAVPLLVGCSRGYLNVHWTTDVVGGWCLGILIASLSVALYERLRL